MHSFMCLSNKIDVMACGKAVPPLTIRMAPALTAALKEMAGMHHSMYNLSNTISGSACRKAVPPADNMHGSPQKQHMKENPCIDDGSGQICIRTNEEETVIAAENIVIIIKRSNSGSMFYC